MKIEFLWFDGCPTHEMARRLLSDAMEELGIDVPIDEIQVETEGRAEAMQFQGSPSIRVDGSDVDPIPVEDAPYGLACRMYMTPDGAQGWPAKETIRAALAAASA